MLVEVQGRLGRAAARPAGLPADQASASSLYRGLRGEPIGPAPLREHAAVAGARSHPVPYPDPVDLRCLECPHAPARPAHTARCPRPTRRRRRRSLPGLTSRRVKRNRRFWAVGFSWCWPSPWSSCSTGRRATRRRRGRATAGPGHHHRPPPPPAGNPRLDPDWEGDGQPVTFAFGGDVHFPAGTNLGDRLAADPADALGPTVPALLSGVDLSMVNLESALTDGTCPARRRPSSTSSTRPPSAISAFKGAGVTLITEANNHGEDCGPPGLQMALDHPGPDRLHHPRHRPERGAGLHPVHDHHPRPAHRDHRRHPGHRLRPADGVDGDRDPAGPGLGLRRERPRGRRGGGAQDRRHGDRLPPLGHRARRLPQPAAGAAGPGAGAGRAPTSSWAPTRTSCSAAATSARPTSTTAWATSPSTTTRRPRTPAARWSSRPPGGTSTRSTWRPAVIVDDLPQPLVGRRRHRGAGRVEPGPVLHQRDGRRPGRPVASAQTETSPAPAAAVQTLSADSG